MKELKNRKAEYESKMSNEMRLLIEKTRTKENPSNLMSIYVVRSLKTSKAQFFEFNNEMMQVLFEDSSEVIFKIPSESKEAALKFSSNSIVTYITKFCEIKQFSLNKLESQAEDVKKRMNYALNVAEKVKKTLEAKENTQTKENNVASNYGSVNPSLEKSKPLERCSSTSKFLTNMSLNR